MTNLAATKAIFVDHKPLQSRSVGRLIFEVPIEQYDAALGALGGTPLPGESRWFAIARLTKQPQGQDNSGSAPSPSLADAADSPAAAPLPRCNRLKCGIHRVLMEPTREIFACTEPDCDRSFHALSNSGDAKAAKPKKHWDELKPSQQAGMACRDASFREWTQDVMASPEHRWDGAEYCDSFMSEEGTKDWPACYVRWYCGVTSRSDLDTNPEAAKRWRELHSMFTADTQYGDRR